MKRIYLLCLMLCLAACGSETDTSLGMNNQPPSIEIKEHVAYRYTVVLANASDDAVITINDLPSWAEFDPETKLISGVPGHENADSEFVFSISAVDGEASFKSDDVTISVVHSNLDLLYLPEGRRIIKESDLYTNQIEVESGIKSLEFTLINAPEWLLINTETGLILGRPEHLHAGKTYSNIQIQVSDGAHVKISEGFDLLVDPKSLYFSEGISNKVTKENEFVSYIETLNYYPEGLIFSAENLPSWATINELTGEITGTPSNSLDIGIQTGIVIVVKDGSRLVRSQPFSIQVEFENDAPIIVKNEIELDGFKNQYEVDFEYYDEETDQTGLDFLVSENSDYYDVTVASEGRIKIDVIDVIKTIQLGITFTVSIDDGEKSTTSLIRAKIIEESPLSITSNFSGDWFVNQDVVINFDQPIDEESLTYSSSAQACNNNIQISLDNFESCIGITGISSKSGLYKFTFTPKDLGINEAYQLRVLPGVKTLFENSTLDVFTSGVYTVSGLLITEIGGAGSVSDMRWFEVYNGSKSAINLNEYKVVTRGVDSAQCNELASCWVEGVEEFELNDLLIQPGQYFIVRGQSWNQRYDDHDRVTYIGGTTFPYWDDFGYIELVKKSNLEITDFVIFGNWGRLEWRPESATDLNSWAGNEYLQAPSYTDDATAYAKSIGRSGKLIDSNRAQDWTLYGVHSAGGPNDVAHTDLDQDQDGLPDSAEVEGSTFRGISLYDLGARVGRKDIFIEVDYMDTDDEGVIPRKEALEMVVDAFSKRDIAVHFDVGDLFDQTEGVNSDNFDLGGGNTIPFSNGITFDMLNLDSRADFYEIKREHLDFSRLPIFHYMVMAYTSNAAGLEDDVKGTAELHGNDIIITMGNWGLNSSTEAAKNQLINYQASTIMHELGHNLGLRHGGHEDVNYKPNYLSVMNYMYAFRGLPTIGSNEGDRFYKYTYSSNPNCDNISMTNPYDGDFREFILDYSSVFTSLDESDLDESKGLQMLGSGPIDFNCNADSTEIGIKIDINSTGSQENLVQYSDWNRINLLFQKSFSGMALSANSIVNTPGDLSLVKDVVGDDRGTIIYEERPSILFRDAVIK